MSGVGEGGLEMLGDDDDLVCEDGVCALPVVTPQDAATVAPEQDDPDVSNDDQDRGARGERR